MDLQKIQTRLGKGVYSDCIHKFFRDLLLLFNNAVIFFRKTSPEHVAAKELRTQVLKEMNHYKLGKPIGLAKPTTTTLELEPKQRASDSFPKSNKSSSIIMVCRKRSSNKPISEDTNKKRHKKEKEVDEGPPPKKANEKKIDGSFGKMEDKGIKRKRRSQERAGGRIDSKSSNKKRGEKETKREYGGNELSSHDGVEVTKMDKKENGGRKKKGVVSFLKRMKQNSPSKEVREEENEETEEEEDEEVEEVSEEEEESKVEKKKKSRKRSDGINRTERVSTRSCSSGARASGGVRQREDIGKAKRGVGRPPKKPTASSSKRSRGIAESEVVVGGGRSRKRLRR